MQSSRLLALALAATALVAPACKKDSTSPGTTVLVFVGTVNGTDGILSGAITLNINGTVVTGSFDVVTPTVASHALTGSYNTTSKALAATGGGYTFGGVFDGVDRMDGGMTGSATGTFVAKKDNNNTAQAFCGTFSGSDDGVFNFTVIGTTISGTATTTSGTVIPLDGTMSGNNISIANPGGGSPLATGTRSGTAVTGTWNDGVGSGNWTGARCN